MRSRGASTCYGIRQFTSKRLSGDYTRCEIGRACNEPET